MRSIIAEYAVTSQVCLLLHLANLQLGLVLLEDALVVVLVVVSPGAVGFE